MEILKNLQLPKQMEAGASTENPSILRVTGLWVNRTTRCSFRTGYTSLKPDLVALIDDCNIIVPSTMSRVAKTNFGLLYQSQAKADPTASYLVTRFFNPAEDYVFRHRHLAH